MARRSAPDSGPHGVLILDKPGGWSSHRVVSRVRKWLGTRKVGHAGTLDPMATGLLVVGVGRCTRLLTFAVGEDKTYTATIRLGQSTPTDDADSEPDRRAPAEAVAALTPDAVEEALEPLRGDIEQTPSAVSAIKVDGVRSYARVRAGEDVELTARPVTVSRFETTSALRFGDGVCDVDVVVDCSSGTYIRALARDLGDALGVGGHLIALRRTRVGGFGLADALPVPDFDAEAPAPELLSPAAAASRLLPPLEVTADERAALVRGQRLPLASHPEAGSGQRAALCGDELVAVVEARSEEIRSVAVFAQP